MHFLNFHIIQPVPFSCLNRDDMGSPKTSVFGGMTRGRLSSQSQKKAARTVFEAETGADLTFRSRLTPLMIEEKALPLLEQMGYEVDDDAKKKVRKEATTQIKRLTDNPKADGEDDGMSKTLVWLAEREIDEAARKIAKKVTGEEPEPLVNSTTGSLTIAAFGRMMAARPDLELEGASQVGHAMMTHETTTEVDYFTAVDDLQAEFEGDAGAGHLNLAEYTSGVFYRWFSLDRDQLRATWEDIDRDDAHDRLTALVQAMILTLPSGRQASTAPHTLPVAVVAEESTQPLTMVAAFERAVPPSSEGFIGASIDAFMKYREQAHAFSPSRFGRARVAEAAPNRPVKGSLDEVVNFAATWLRESS